MQQKTPVNVSQMIENLGLKRKRKFEKRREDENCGWEELEDGNCGLQLKKVDPTHTWALPIFREGISKGEIFLKIIDSEVISRMIDSALEHSSTAFSFGKQGDFGVSEARCYRILAIAVRILGLQAKPSESERNPRPLRRSVLEALSHFGSFSHKPPGIVIVEKMLSNLLIGVEVEETVNKKLLSCLRKLGEFVAGDEKLFRFTGNSGMIRKVPNKPDGIGIWHYELTARLSNGMPFLVYLKTHKSDSLIGSCVAVSKIVEDWMKVIKKKGWPDTFLVADSYYLDNTGRAILLKSGVNFICAIQKNRFQRLTEMAEHKVRKPGECSIFWNENSKETLVHVWDCNSDIGKKYLLCSCLEKTKKKQKKHLVPGYDEYKVCLSLCDQFNRKLHDKVWPFRRGGGKKFGDFGNIHDFNFGSVIQNVFSMFLAVNNIPSGMFEFREFCLDLSDEIYRYSCENFSQ